MVKLTCECHILRQDAGWEGVIASPSEASPPDHRRREAEGNVGLLYLVDWGWSIRKQWLAPLYLHSAGVVASSNGFLHTFWGYQIQIVVILVSRVCAILAVCDISISYM